MANRDLTTFNTVVQHVAENPSQLPQMVASFGTQIMRQGQEARINDNLSKAQLELNQLQTKYQIEYESRPEAGLDAYRQARKDIFDKYGQDVSPLFKRYWEDAARDVIRKNDGVQQGWVLKQTRVNTVNSLNESMRNSFKLANINGQNYGNADSAEIEAFLDFAQAKRGLAGFGNANLGEETTKTILADFDRDYLKSFISGVASTNPMKAAQLLENKAFRGMLGADDIDTFEKVIETQQNRQKLGSLVSRMQNEELVLDLVNDDSQSYYDKRLEIDTMEMNGQISKNLATLSRRVLTSKKSVDAITSTPEMAEIITQMYDLNAISDTSSEDYLNGVNNVRAEILRRQDEGKLNPTDAQKLQNQLRTLTSAKMADATQRVGYSFYDAKKIFDNQLPPEYRGQAIRQLFYQTTGQEKLSKQQYQAKAKEIVDDMKKSIREETEKRVRQLTMTPEDFLMTTVNPETGKLFTMDDVRETAIKHNMTEQDVVNWIRSRKK